MAKTYAKQYTAQSIKLTGRTKKGTAYLSLVFNYGFGELVMTKMGPKTVYSKLTMGVGTVDARHWGDQVFTDAFIRNHGADHSKLVASIESARAKVWAAYQELIADGQPKPSPDQIMTKIKGTARVNERITFGDYCRRYAQEAHGQSHPLTRAKYHTLGRMWDALEQVRTMDGFQPAGTGPVYLNTFDHKADWSDFCQMIRRSSVRITTVFRGPSTDRRGRRPKRAMMFTDGDRAPLYSMATLIRYQENTRTVLRYAQEQDLAPATKMGVMKRDKADKADKVGLSPVQLATLFNARMEDPQLENARKVFALMCAAGVPISDVNQLVEAPMDIVQGQDMAIRVKTLVRSKTQTEQMIPLMAPALALLSDPVKPVVKPYMVRNNRLNKQIRKVCQMLGMDHIVTVVVPKANKTKPIERGPFYAMIHAHTGRAVFKTLCQHHLGVARDLVCQVQAHALNDRNADAAYLLMTRIDKVELFVQQCELRAGKLPFVFMPPPVVLTNTKAA